MRRAAPGSPANEAAARGACCLAIAQCRDAIDPDIINAGRKLVRDVVGRVILDLAGVEHHDIGEVALAQAAAKDFASWEALAQGARTSEEKIDRYTKALAVWTEDDGLLYKFRAHWSRGSA